MLILSPADRAALWQQTISSAPEAREGMLHVLAKEMQDIVGAELEVYFGLDEQFEQTLGLLDRSGLIGRDELRRAFEVVGIPEEDERGIDAAEFVLVLAGLLEETADVEHLEGKERVDAHRLAGRWREQVEAEEAPPVDAMLTVAEVASHFDVTPRPSTNGAKRARSPSSEPRAAAIGSPRPSSTGRAVRPEGGAARDRPTPLGQARR